MSFVYEDESNDFGQAKYEKTYGSRLEAYYNENRDQAIKEKYNPEDLAKDMYAKGKHVEPNEDYDTWAKRHSVGRFVESANYYNKQISNEKEDAPIRARNEAERGDMVRGLASGIDETQGSLGGGGLMYLAKMVNTGLQGQNAPNFVGDWLLKKGSEYYHEQMREASLNPTKSLISDKPGQLISDDIQDGGDILDWAQGEFAKLLPTMALGLASGLAGGAIATTGAGGRAIASPVMRSFVKKQADQLLAKGFVQPVAGKTAQQVAEHLAKKQIGGRAGAWIGTSLLETSGAFADTVAHLQEKYVSQGMARGDALLKAHEDSSALLAGATGIIAGGVEMLGGNIKILDKILGKTAASAADDLIRLAKSSRATPTIMGRSLNAVRDLFVQAVKAAPAEFAQEATQEILSMLNIDFADPDFNLTSPENLKQALAAGIAGAVGGGMAAFGSASYDKARSGSASSNLVKSAASLQQQIANQQQYIRANPGRTAEVMPLIEQNRSELKKLGEYGFLESQGVSYAEAIRQIQAGAPNPNGKKFNARALKKLLESQDSPLTEVKDSAGKAVRGTVDSRSIAAHIQMRNGTADAQANPNVNPQAGPQAGPQQEGELRSNVVATVKDMFEDGDDLDGDVQIEDEGEYTGSPGFDETGRPAPPAASYDSDIRAQVLEEASETVDVSDTKAGSSPTEVASQNAAPSSESEVEIPYETVSFDGEGKPLKKGRGKAKRLNLGGRQVVVRNINGVNVPFYLSSGAGGKKDVASGKWYPFFGVSADGWLNKLGGQEMVNHYGSAELKRVAEELDATLGDIRDDDTAPKAKIEGAHTAFINAGLGFAPAENETAGADKTVRANIASLLARIEKQEQAVAKPAPKAAPKESGAKVEQEGEETFDPEDSPYLDDEKGKPVDRKGKSDPSRDMQRMSEDDSDGEPLPKVSSWEEYNQTFNAPAAEGQRSTRTAARSDGPTTVAYREAVDVIKQALTEANFEFTDNIFDYLPNILDRVSSKFLTDTGAFEGDTGFIQDASHALSYIVFSDLKLQEGDHASREKIEQVISDWLVTGKLPTDGRSFAKRVVDSIKRFIKTVLQIIDDEMLDYKVSRRLAQLRGGNGFSFTVKPGTERLSFQDVFDSTPGLTDIFAILTRTGGVLTGSHAYMDETSVFRKPGQPSHDTDILYSSRADIDEAEAEFKGRLNAVSFYKFDGDGGRHVSSLIVPPKGHSVSDVKVGNNSEGDYLRTFKVRNKAGEVVGNYSYMISSDRQKRVELVDGVACNILDLLEYPFGELSYKNQKYRDGNSELSVPAIRYFNGFAAKLKMLRYKDVHDLALSKPVKYPSESIFYKGESLRPLGLSTHEQADMSSAVGEYYTHIAKLFFAQSPGSSTGTTIVKNLIEKVIDEAFGLGSYARLRSSGIIADVTPYTESSHYSPLYNNVTLRAGDMTTESSVIDNVLHEIGVHYGIEYLLSGIKSDKPGQNPAFEELRSAIKNVMIRGDGSESVSAFGDTLNKKSLDLTIKAFINTYNFVVEQYGAKEHHSIYPRFKNYKLDEDAIVPSDNAADVKKIEAAFNDDSFMHEFIGILLQDRGASNIPMVQHLRHKFNASVGDLFQDKSGRKTKITLDEIHAIIVGATQKAIDEGKNIPPAFVAAELYPSRQTEPAQTSMAHQRKDKSITIVPTAQGEVFGMRGPKGEHMETKGIKPGQPGWLGNPVKWEGNGGEKGVKIGFATSEFRRLFLKRIEENPEFKAAVLALRGKKVGYYRPQDENHLQVVQEWLADYSAEEAKTSKSVIEPKTFAEIPRHTPGQKTMVYAGVGSRTTPGPIKLAMKKAAEMLEAAGYSLRTGDAVGADAAFASGATSKEVFTKKDATDVTRGIAKEVHPRPDLIGQPKMATALDLHARNTNQIFGRDLQSPVDFVLAWTPDGAESEKETGYGRPGKPDTGGTGQAIRLASMKGVPVINIAKPGWEARLQAILDGKEDKAAPVDPGVARTPASTVVHQPVAGKTVAPKAESPLPSPNPQRTPDAPLQPRAVATTETKEVGPEKPHLKIVIRAPGTPVSNTRELRDLDEDVDRSATVTWGTTDKDIAAGAGATPMPKSEVGQKRAFKSRLTKKQRAALTKIGEVDPDADLPHSTKPERDTGERKTTSRAAARKSLIKNGGMAFLIGEVVSIETPSNPDFEHSHFGPFDLKLPFTFFESAKAYWADWLARIRNDIHKTDSAMKRLPPVSKALYEKMLVIERGLTIMSGKLAPENRAAFDATLARVEAEGADDVRGRIDIETALKIVEGLKQAVSEQGRQSMTEFLNQHTYLDAMYRFAHFMRAAGIFRAGLTGQPGSLAFSFKGYNAEGKLSLDTHDLGADGGKLLVSHLMNFYGDILTHMSGIGVLTSEQATALSLENNTLDGYSFAGMPAEGDVAPGSFINFTRNALFHSLNATGMGGAIIPGMPVPVTTSLEGDATELSEALDAFHAAKDQDPALAALTDSEFIIGIIGMGLGSAGIKKSGIDPRLANIYDINKLPVEFMQKMEAAGFIKIQRYVENFQEIWTGYTVNDHLSGVLGEIRPKTFMKEIDQQFNPRPTFYVGEQLVPTDGILPDLRTVRPGSVLINQASQTFGVVGPVSKNGEFEILVPRENEFKTNVLTPVLDGEGKPRLFSKTMLGKLGYLHVPALWDFLQGRMKGDDFQAQNAFGWQNADSVIESQGALLDAEIESGITGLRAMGHGSIVIDPQGRKYLALASQSGDQALIEVTSAASPPVANLQDAMLRLHNEIREAVTSMIDPSSETLTATQMKRIRRKIRATIDSLVERNQLSKAEADDLRAEMGALYKAVMSALPDINDAQGPLLQRLYSVLGQSGFLSSEASQEFIITEELMGATSELQQKGRSVDEDGQQESFAFSNATAFEMMSSMGFSEMLRDMLGLSKVDTFAEAYDKLKLRATNSLSAYRAATKEGASQGVISRLYRETKALFMALRAIKKGNLMFATKTGSPEVALAAYKAAREALGLRSVESGREMSDLAIERMQREVLDKPLPTKWLTEFNSPLYQSAPKKVRRVLKGLLMDKVGNTAGLMSMLSGQEQFTLGAFSRVNHPNARPLVLHILSILSTMPTVNGDRMSALASNIAYYKALREMPIQMMDSSSVKLSALSKTDRELVTKMMASGGLYIQLVDALRFANSKMGADGNIAEWASDPKSWPLAGSEDAKAMYEKAMEMKIDSSQSVLGLYAALDLPKSSTVDTRKLALQLGTALIPADAAMMLEGLGPEERKGVYDVATYQTPRVQLFLQNAGAVYLRPKEFYEALDDALLNGEALVGDSDSDNITAFESDGITYKLLSQAALEQEEASAKGVEIAYEHGSITGLDYELLLHLQKIDSSFYKFSGGRISRDGRSSVLNMNGELFPIIYTDKTLSSFGESLLQVFRRIHDDAWKNPEIPEYERIRIREQMVEWEKFRRQQGAEAEAELRRRGNFRTARSDPKRLLTPMDEESEGRFLEDVLRQVQKMIATVISIPAGERPRVVIHGMNETGADLLKTAAGRLSLPSDIMARITAEDGNAQAMTDLRRAMGLVTADGVIHIFPRMHADAAGNLDKVELARTVFHEIVGHVALRKILGTEYESFMLSVFKQHVDPKGQINYSRDMKILAAEEYIASMADKLTYNPNAARLTNPHIGTIIDRIASMLMQAYRRFMAKYGKTVEISKVEIRELLANAFAGTPVRSSGYQFVGPALIPGENLGRYDEYGELKANLADRFLKTMTDRLHYWDMLFRSKEADMVRIVDEQHFMYGLRTLGSRVGYLTGLSADLEQKFIKSFEGKNFDQKTVAEILLALHTLERNEADSGLYLQMLPDYLRKKGSVTPSPEEAARGITEDNKIAIVVNAAKKRIEEGTFKRTTGFTSNWAKDRLDDAKTLGLYDAATGRGSAAESINALMEASKMSLAVAEEAGMVSHEAAETFRNKFQFFVPIPKFGQFGFGDLEGFRLQGQGRFAANFDAGIEERSPDAEDPDVISYTFSNLRARIVEGEINKTNQLIANFAMANPNAGVFTMFLHPEEVRWYTDTEGVEQYDIPAGFAQMALPLPEPGKDQLTQAQLREYEQRQGLIPVYQNGKLRYFRIEHEGLRTTYQGFMNPAKAGWVMKKLAVINRWLVAVNTMLNPEFMLPNIFRDAGAAMTTLSIHGTVAGISGKTGTEFVKEFSPRIVIAMRVIYAHKFGGDLSALTGDAAIIAKYIEEFSRVGGEIQWPYMESAAETMKNLNTAIALIQGRGTAGQQAAAFSNNMLDFMKRTASIFENATRLAAYVTARENGAGYQRSALLSREMTVDFDRKGELGQFFNTLYLFANASVQGSLVIARAIIYNPVRAAKILSAGVSLSFSLACMALLTGGNGDDDEPNFFSLPQETRNSNIILMLPFGESGTAFKMPVAHGYAAVWALGQEMANAIFGRGGAGSATLGVVSSLLSNFNPLESSAGVADTHGLLRLVSPTIIDPIWDIGFEKTPFGTPLMPEKVFEQQPDSARHWRSVSGVSKEATRLLNELFNGSGGKSSGITDISPETLDLMRDTVGGGLGKFFARTASLVFAPVTGKDLSVNDLPIVRRFVGGQLNWEDRGRFKSNYAEVQGANRTMKNLEDNVRMAKIPKLKAQAIRDRDDFRKENRHILELRVTANRVLSRSLKIDKQKEALYKSGFSDSHISDKLKALDQEQKRHYSDFNKKYYKMVDSR